MNLAIDIGGTKVLLATFSSEGRLLDSKKIKTPQDYPTFLDELQSATHELLAGKRPQSCAIALPGKIDRTTGTALYFGNLPWENIELRNDLADTISCPIYLENDAKAAALAEADALKDTYKRVLYITISTGIGWGLVQDGVLDQHVNDGGGKSFRVEHEGKVLSWETYASGKAIANHYGKLASEIDQDDPAWYKISRNLAVPMNELNELLGPECIVVGGGAGANLHKFKDHLVTEMEILSHKMSQKIPTIVTAQHPEEAVVYGCHLLCEQNKAA